MDELDNPTGAATDVAADAYQSPGREGGYTRDGQPLAPTVDQSKAAKLESTYMTDEFGRNGVTDSIHSGLSANADPSQYTTDADGEVRRLGQTLEQQERSEGLNAELDDIHDNNVYRDDAPEGGAIWARFESNEGREEAHQAEMVDEVSEPVTRPHETTDPQTLISSDQLGEVNRYAAMLAERFDVSTAELSRRMAWKLAPALVPDNPETKTMTVPSNDYVSTAEITRFMSWEQIEMLSIPSDKPLISQTVEVSHGIPAAPVSYRGTDDDGHDIWVLHDAYKPKKYDPLNAAEVLRSELLYELPEHTEGIKASHSSADAVGVVTKLFDPKRRDQVQVGRAEDADGNEFGFCIFRNSVTERWSADNWKTPADIQMVGIGDTIQIDNAKPKAYRNIISLTVTSKSTVRVLERGDGPVITNNHQSENTGQIANPRPMSRHNHVMS